MENIREGLGETDYEIIGTIPVGAPFEKLESNKRLVDAADLVVLNGEGSIHHERPYSLSMTEALEYAISKGKKVALINALWQGNNAEMAAVAGRTNLLYVRDRRSQTELGGFGISAAYAPDMTFSKPVRSTVRAVEGRLAVTDSFYKQYTAEAYRYCRQHREVSYAPMIRSRLVHTWREDNRSRKLKEALYLRLLKLSGGRLPMRQYYKDLMFQQSTPQAYIDYLAGHEAVVCYRFHALCFCLQAGIPFIAIRSNSWKVEALLEEIGLSLQERMLSHEEVLANGPAELVERARQSDRDKQLINDFLISSQADNARIFSEIGAIVAAT
ncbi:hypothetical protein A8C75_01265 [Marinobacterium aestuarii]|uniref:Polysaccharide pyruvyl transferase domain-containing protein n=2 Tax=Marinobacterium aestuarii TaxID=1821621 RepID=A0A1A9EUA0_9GAMM|nr:hypothetical protein A8C75_01265 [Marinobacterium aestuarii]